MKKIILGVAVAGLVISCQKIQAGSNKGVMQMEHGVERYSDDVVTGKSSTDIKGSASAVQDSVKSNPTNTAVSSADSAAVIQPMSESAAPEQK